MYLRPVRVRKKILSKTCLHGTLKQIKIGDSVYGVFENKLPCLDEGCTKLKFALAIYSNTQNKLPTTYMMARVYVARDENGRITNTGDISILKGIPSDSTATVYNLTSGAPDEFKYF